MKKYVYQYLLSLKLQVGEFHTFMENKYPLPQPLPRTYQSVVKTVAAYLADTLNALTQGGLKGALFNEA